MLLIVANKQGALLIPAGIAQLVEQRTENPRVTGSSPVPGITFTLKHPLTYCINLHTTIRDFQLKKYPIALLAGGQGAGGKRKILSE